MAHLRRYLTLALSLSALLLCACQKEAAPPPAADTPPPEAVEQLEPQAVNVYFADKDVEHLEPESRDVVAGTKDELLAAVVNELLAGPDEKDDHVRVIPEGTTLNSVNLDGDIAVVDLSKEFVEKFDGGSNTASLALYSLVNSLCEIDGVKKVRILLAGQPGGEFGGVFDLSEAFEADPGLSGGEKL